MRRSTAVRVAAIIGVVWAATLLPMLVDGDPQARDLLREFVGLSVLAGAIAWATYHLRVLPRRESFEVRAKDAGLRAASGDPRCMCVVDEAGPEWPDLAVVPAEVVAAAAAAVGLGDQDLESERFNRAFEVRSSDRRFASAMLDARMMEWLLAQAPGVGFEILGGRLMVFEPRMRSSVDDLARALERYDGFLEHVPRIVLPSSPSTPVVDAAPPER